MESSCSMRPWQVHLGMENHPRPYRQPRHLARPGRRTARSKRRGNRRAHHLGRRVLCQEHHHYCRHFPQRTDARGKKDGGRWKMRRTCRSSFHGKHHPMGNHISKNENGNSCPHRQAERSLRRHGGATGRHRFPSVLVHGQPQSSETASLLDMLHKQQGTRNPEKRIG